MIKQVHSLSSDDSIISSSVSLSTGWGSSSVISSFVWYISMQGSRHKATWQVEHSYEQSVLFFIAEQRKHLLRLRFAPSGVGRRRMKCFPIRRNGVQSFTDICPVWKDFVPCRCWVTIAFTRLCRKSSCDFLLLVVFLNKIKAL